MKKKKLLTKIYSILFFLIGKLPKNKKKIMFESYLGKQYSCNPRAIFEYLKREENHYQYEMIWSVNKKHEKVFKELGLKYSNRFSVSWLWNMATAKYWITNSRLPLWLPKPKSTMYIQTWHGTPLKKLANDMEEVHMPGTNTEKYKQNFTKESSKWDILISPNKYSTKIFRSAFKYRQSILETGYPRNDILSSKDTETYINEIKKQLNIQKEKKIILYAPTWRDDSYFTKGSYKFNLELDLKLFKEQLGDKAVILLRMHYLVTQNFNLKEYEGFVLNVTNYPDIRDLYLISDMLITDYSSVFFDFAILKKPIVFFVYDIENYRDKLRGFYFNIEKLAPGPIVKTNKELIKEIKESLQNSPFLKNNYENFHNEYCELEDGNATKRVVESLFSKTK
ncbi:CDP-glycerol glycerophosphotransferase family protein [Bacillus inaquosorum]|uniref:CDP-glycerol glycerophosphotransferase family protein n=1 Tax=Bacillus inaquosorum TaxID=483913 RepID=UPI0022812601|nr:CDP-glycerol glycerophosphotransferase family protein [Bacillus inaquosorum]MCY9010354.1 CDP-glycerol glycerophosphotransferase family protein [Bacillus inaquosorum]MCY9037888.1 CDP-glycerol glycerophosphotransferase family protein [Bacillus inaquosorum]MCY9044836.1 CDP-glycerol glycerophosphotransferase family protein [Bacillus inaquosorum]